MIEETLERAADAARDAAAPPTAGDSETKAAGTQDQSVEWKARADELLAALARSQADFENYRKRARQEREDTARYGVERLLKALLPVLDNLERALAAMPADGALRQGVELTSRQFGDALAREGVTPVEAVGLPFDPRLHEAVTEEESGEHPEGTVLAEFQKGYRLHDRVLRPSMVKVSKRGGEGQ